MAEIEKLNKTFQSEEVLTAENMNNITGKIDEVIEEVNNPTNAPKGGYNRALFEAAGAVYNEETGFYELNGLTDITEDEMCNIYIAFNYLNKSYLYKYSPDVRTTIPLKSFVNPSSTIFTNADGFDF